MPVQDYYVNYNKRQAMLPSEAKSNRLANQLNEQQLGLRASQESRLQAQEAREAEMQPHRLAKAQLETKYGEQMIQSDLASARTSRLATQENIATSRSERAIKVGEITAKLGKLYNAADTPEDKQAVLDTSRDFAASLFQAAGNNDALKELQADYESGELARDLEVLGKFSGTGRKVKSTQKLQVVGEDGSPKEVTRVIFDDGSTEDVGGGTSSKPLIQDMEKRNKAWQSKAEKAETEYGIATNMKNQVAQMREIFKDVKTGPGAQIALPVSQIATFFGADMAKYGSAAEAMQNLSTQQVLNFIGLTKGSISDAEMGMFYKSIPTLSTTPEGRELILEGMNALADAKLRRTETIRQINIDSRDARDAEQQLLNFDKQQAKNRVFSEDFKKRIEIVRSSAPKPINYADIATGKLFYSDDKKPTKANISQQQLNDAANSLPLEFYQ